MGGSRRAADGAGKGDEGGQGHGGGRGRAVVWRGRSRQPGAATRAAAEGVARL